VRAAAINSVATRFQSQISAMINGGEDRNDHVLRERITKAIGYFVGELTTGMLIPINAQLDKRGPKTKKYTIELRSLKAATVRRLEQLKNVYLADEHLSANISFPDLEKENRDLSKPVRSEKQPKGASQRETLALHQQGMAVEMIAEQRGLTMSTVMSHLADFVATGVVGIDAVVSRQKADVISGVLKDMKGEPLVSVKNKLGNDYSYAEIKAVVSHQIWSKDTVSS
jgi:hypothetical protein